MMSKPSPDQYTPNYQAYIGLIEEDNLIEALENGQRKVREFILSFPKDRLEYVYEAGKWTIRQVLLHITDTERIMSYRALRFARNDQTNLPGFDQDQYMQFANISGRKLPQLSEEFMITRESTLSLFRTFDETCLKRQGTANGKGVSVLALGYIIAGHCQHHLNILNQKYLS